MFRFFTAVIVASSILNASGCPYLDSLKKQDESTRSLRATPYSAPTEALETDYQAPIVSSSKRDICLAFVELKKEYLNRLKAFPGYTSNPALIKSNILGKIVRLVFHDAGEFHQGSSDKLGMDGCLSSSGENAGLVESGGLVDTFINPLHTYLLGKNIKISKADFYTLLGKISIEEAWQFGATPIPYYYGRRDNLACEGGNGRLPGAQQPQIELQRVFVNQMGMSIAEGVTLLGAHTVGHVHPQFTGYGKPGTNLNDAKNNAFDETPDVFDNNYFKVNIGEPWINSIFQSNKNQWLVAESGHPDTIFTNTDMFMTFPIDITGTASVGKANQLCKEETSCVLLIFCSKKVTCSPSSAGRSVPSTLAQVKKYADNNLAFLNDFSAAYKKMTTRGYGVSDFEFITPSAGKLGTLKYYPLLSLSLPGLCPL